MKNSCDQNSKIVLAMAERSQGDGGTFWRKFGDFLQTNLSFPRKARIAIQLLNLLTAQSRAVVCHREHHARADHDQFAKRVSITHTWARVAIL
jgi:hypothetical protein